jgi:hypothetical protein
MSPAAIDHKGNQNSSLLDEEFFFGQIIIRVWDSRKP